jgi:hypothetical protein
MRRRHRRRRRLRQHPPPRRRRRHRRPKLIETERGGRGRAGEEIEPPPLWLGILACRRCLHMHATETGLTREAGTGRR